MIVIYSHIVLCIWMDVWLGGFRENAPFVINIEHLTFTSYPLPAITHMFRFQGWRDQMFVVTSRMKPGVSLTLGKFDILQRCFPQIQPFPSWAHQGGPSPQALHNAVDLYMDTRDRLWVLDSGLVNVLSSRPERMGPPKVLGFDALTGKVSWKWGKITVQILEVCFLNKCFINLLML